MNEVRGIHTRADLALLQLPLQAVVGIRHRRDDGASHPLQPIERLLHAPLRVAPQTHHRLQRGPAVLYARHQGEPPGVQRTERPLDARALRGVARRDQLVAEFVNLLVDGADTGDCVLTRLTDTTTADQRGQTEVVMCSTAILSPGAGFMNRRSSGTPT